MNMPMNDDQTIYFDVVDDEIDFCEFVCDIALPFGFSVNDPVAPQQFIDNYASSRKDVVVLDINMPNVDGIELMRFMAANQPPSALILVSGVDETIIRSTQKLAEELDINVLGTLQKPFRKKQLEELLSQCLDSRSQSDCCKVVSLQPTEKDLHEAIDNERFDIVFQPQYGSSDSDVIGVEVLARWQHPTLGNISPGVFIPMAESMDRIYDLDLVIFKKAVAQFSQLKDIAKLKMSINMSSLDFFNLQLPDIIVRQLEEHAISPDDVLIEVTETAVMQDLGSSLDTLTRLRLKGIHLSVDDFGTGFSSMSQLVRIPFSELKIDSSFVEGIDKDPACKAVVKTSISLAHELGLQVVAEGVSSLELLTAVREMGCNTTQGFYQGRPMPLESMKAMLLAG